MPAALKFWCLLIREAETPLFVCAPVGCSADLRALCVPAVVVVREVHKFYLVL